MTSLTESGYLSKESAKIYTSLSPRTLEYAVYRGELRAFRVGKRILFAREDLDLFVRQKKAGADLDRIVDEVVREVGAVE